MRTLIGYPDDGDDRDESSRIFVSHGSGKSEAAGAALARVVAALANGGGGNLLMGSYSASTTFAPLQDVDVVPRWVAQRSPGVAAAVAVTRASGFAIHRPELVSQEQLLEAVVQWVYAAFGCALGCGVYSETGQFWGSFAVACGMYLGLAALPRRRRR